MLYRPPKKKRDHGLLQRLTVPSNAFETHIGPIHFVKKLNNMEQILNV